MIPSRPGPDGTAPRAGRRPASGSRPSRCGSSAAVFYEIHIRGFFDGNGDGSGDFRGLTEKLDYLQWLGIDCIWLLPLLPSPRYATAATTSPTSPRSTRTTARVDDVHELIDAAHARRSG